MHPILLTIPVLGSDVSSFGAMMMLGFLAAYFLTARELPRQQIDSNLGISLLIFIMLGGVFGAKIYYATDMAFRDGLPWSTYFFNRTGLTWYGGLLGGIGAAAMACRVYGLSFRRLLNAGAVATAVGQTFGRLGCFLAGDDYGTPSSLPWAVAFPLGSPPTRVPVHPTQLYEVAWLVPVAAVLYARRKKSSFLFGEYLAANGFGRLVIENFRVNPRVALGMTEPQLIGIVLIIVGVAGCLYFRRVDQRSNDVPLADSA